ncbi:DUF1350 family protein [Calothrix sp. NIES-3974]|uniref:DUF1350 family protein n=1 Tax=Calothrix sp. NIES-3974 TaxID=2005462 RepID=UPI000B5F4907|nr:DUF1350 family protein [Calothrix sp. NIES-3974]BAZ03691.1 hypothetical protein NIES3974_03200 [Calothrix sp. NIES-3974]
MDWKEIAGNWVLVPIRPRGIVHFLGGAFVATAPHITYRLLLEALAEEGYMVIATPFINTFDHSAIAQQVLRNFERGLIRLEDRGIIGSGYLPIYGMGHSMGCKLHLLIGSMFPVERAGNIFISFNNFAARDAVPLIQQLNTTFANTTLVTEFTPTPAQTNDMIRASYNVRRNLVIKFTNDTLDQSLGLNEVLEQRFPGMVVTQILPGTHLTPLGQDIKWQVGTDFNPFDAVGQWFRQEILRDFNQLKKTVLFWLNPLR